MARIVYLLLICLLWTFPSSAAERWNQLGASPGEIALDTDQCNREALEKMPPKMARVSSATPPGRRVDLNSEARREYFNTCMIRRGYKP